MPTYNGISYPETDFLDYGYKTTVTSGTGVSLPRWQAALVDAIADAGKQMRTTSVSSVAVGTGTKTFVNVTDLPYQAGDVVRVTDTSNSANYMFGTVTSYTSATKTLIMTVASGDTGGSGTIASWNVAVAGLKGSTGANTGYRYTYSTTTTASDPGTGTLRFNNATLASATAFYVSETTLDSQAIAADIATWDDSTSTLRGRLRVMKYSDPTVFAVFNITGTITDSGTWDTYTVAYVTGSGSLSNSDTVVITFVASGDAGTAYDISASSADIWGNIANFPFSSGVGTAGNKLISKANWLAGLAADTTFNAALFGKQNIWCPSGFIRPSSSVGSNAVATVTTAANQPDIYSLDFDPTTQWFAQFSIRMPEQWDEGTVTAQFVWSHAATTTNFGVVWNLQASAVSDGDTIAAAYGTAQQVTDTGGTTNTQYISPSTSAITIAGSPAAGDMVYFRVSRVAADGADTMAINARLHGVILSINTVKGNDS